MNGGISTRSRTTGATALSLFFSTILFFRRAIMRRKIQNSRSEACSEIRRIKILSVNEKVPAVAFIYYRDGKPLYRAINEFSEDAFFGNPQNPGMPHR